MVAYIVLFGPPCCRHGAELRLYTRWSNIMSYSWSQNQITVSVSRVMVSKVGLVVRPVTSPAASAESESKIETTPSSNSSPFNMTT